MKKHLFGILVLLIIIAVACNTKQEEPVTTHQSYMQDPVGINKDGAYRVTNLEVIKGDWESKLPIVSQGVKLVDFRIEKGITTGDEAKEFYILIARTADKKLKAASLLELKEGKFYFDLSHATAHDSYGNIVCIGECVEGCDPAVSFYNGTKYLNCSACATCIKKESEMH